jgi:two-component system, cell cycle sensor histidine kinase and response regulator CckA
MSRFLIVDDKEQDSYLLRILFEKSGYVVDVAHDGVQALTMARSNPPDLVVSDILMPVMDGFTLCREWRRDERLNSIPFVFYTATYADPRDEKFALTLGADKFIVKPVEPAVLLDSVKEILSNHSRRETPTPGSSMEDDKTYFKNYSETLVRKLEDKLELFHTIFDIDSSAIFMLSPLHIILELNRAAEKLCGVRGEEALDRNFIDSFIPDSGSPAFTEQLKAALRGSSIHNFEGALRSASGPERTVLWNAQRLLRSSGTIEGVLLIGNDITERLSAERQRTTLETQLRHAQKMEAIGAFASGIAHDFNNILTGIIGFVDMTRVSVPLDSKAEGYLQNALGAANRAKELVKSILSIARGSQDAFKPFEIAPLIQEAGKLLRASIPASIDISLDIDDKCGTIMCDPSQIHQVLMNLCTNAYHAIGDNNGVIGISCHCLDKTVRLSDSGPDLIPGTHIVIEVTDTGTGMSAKTMARIFDTYFTTKEKGKGTGLGLSVTKAIVHAHGGKIQVESTEGKGSIFRVFLPKQETAAPAVRSVDSDKWETGGNESILLVEDDEINGPMLLHALTVLKYGATLVSNGMEALTLLKRDPARYDILLTDLTMPKMGGLELARESRIVKPELPVILMSGNLYELPQSHLDSLGITHLLIKPFDMGELSRALKSIGKSGKS